MMDQMALPELHAWLRSTDVGDGGIDYFPDHQEATPNLPTPLPSVVQPEQWTNCHHRPRSSLSNDPARAVLPAASAAAAPTIHFCRQVGESLDLNNFLGNNNGNGNGNDDNGAADDTDCELASPDYSVASREKTRNAKRDVVLAGADRMMMDPLPFAAETSSSPPTGHCAVPLPPMAMTAANGVVLRRSLTGDHSAVVEPATAAVVPNNSTLPSDALRRSSSDWCPATATTHAIAMEPLAAVAPNSAPHRRASLSLQDKSPMEGGIPDIRFCRSLSLPEQTNNIGSPLLHRRRHRRRHHHQGSASSLLSAMERSQRSQDRVGRSASLRACSVLHSTRGIVMMTETTRSRVLLFNSVLKAGGGGGGGGGGADRRASVNDAIGNVRAAGPRGDRRASVNDAIGDAIIRNGVREHGAARIGGGYWSSPSRGGERHGQRRFDLPERNGTVIDDGDEGAIRAELQRIARDIK